MTKARKTKFSQAENAALKKLREKGLYKPKDARKKTKYAKSLLSKFKDVLSGNAGVVKVDRETAKRYKRKDAKSSEIRSAGNHVIVPKLPGERVSYSKKNRRVDVSRKMKDGGRYVRSPFVRVPTSYDELKSQLATKDRIAVAYYRGPKKPVEWQYFDATDFYTTFVSGYAKESNDAQIKALKWALSHSMISRYEPGKPATASSSNR